ncbi:MAG: alkaline phosphatase D family protein, partial [Acidobacteriota bacterium]
MMLRTTAMSLTAVLAFLLMPEGSGTSLGEGQLESEAGLRITHAVASGDVTHDSAVVWARASAAGEMVVEYDMDPGFPNPGERRTASSRESDFTAQVELESLRPGTRYHYRLHFVDLLGRVSRRQEGTFRTAPDPDTAVPVSFVIGADLGGQRYCRQVGRGYEIFRRMEELSPDFFIANGDMIYADDDCPEDGPDGWKNVPGGFPAITSPEVDWTDEAQVQEVYWKHWRYNRADAHFQEFLRKTPVYVQWDDHEVINDFGAPWPTWPWDVDREGFPNLVAAGRRAFFHYHPMHHDPSEPNRIYRSFRWGADLDLFLLDGRSYRSSNDLADGPSYQKTLLGRDQLEWLKQGLASSPATWKVVSSDVPLSVPTGSRADLYGRDAWAKGLEDDYSSRTGFERELLDLVTFLDAEGVRNVVFVATDVHFAMSLRYEIDADGDGDRLLFHEFLSGPLNAGPRPTPLELDPTLKPVILYGEG